MVEAKHFLKIKNASQKILTNPNPHCFIAITKASACG
jgi:hypothetical protein